MSTRDHQDAIFLALGSNLGEREQQLLQAMDKLKEFGISILNQAQIIESAPIDCPSGSGAYLNTVIEVQTSLSAKKLLELCLSIESKLGRERTGIINEAREIDIDLLFYGQEISNSDFLSLPHPRFHLRDFVLSPLLEIAPKFCPPGFTGQSIQDLHKALSPCV